MGVSSKSAGVRKITSVAKSVSRLTGAVSLLCVSGFAHAGFYVSGGVGMAMFDYDDVDSSFGYNLGGGYQFNENFSLEIMYSDTGSADIEGTHDLSGFAGIPPGTTMSNGTLNTSVVSALLTFSAPVGEMSRVFVRGGFYTGDTEFNVRVSVPGNPPFEVSDSTSTSGLAIGVGFDWMLTQQFGFRGSVDGLVRNKDFAEDETLTTLSLGVIFRFGGRE